MHFNVATTVSIASAAACLSVAVFCWRFAYAPANRHFRFAAVGTLADAGYCLTDVVIAAGMPVGPTAWAGRLGLLCACLHSAAWIVFLANWAQRRLGLGERILVGANLTGMALALLPNVAVVSGEMSSRTIPALGLDYHDPHVGPLGNPVMVVVCVAHLRILITAFEAARTGARGKIVLTALLALIVAVVLDWLSGNHVLMLPNLLDAALAGVPLAIGAVLAGEAADDARRLVRQSAELDEARAQLVERERLAALGELAAVVAHEVRNPLTVIYSALGALRRKEREETEQELLTVVEHEATRLRQLVTQLLDVVRPLELQYAPRPVGDVMHGAVKLATSWTGHTDDEVVCEGDVGKDVECDEVLLGQALSHLVTNALVAEDRRSPVRIGVQFERGGDLVRLEVRDDGRGVPDDVKDRLFSPFFTTRPTGTGLGLAISRRIVEAHGGTIEHVMPEEGGACFILHIPRMASRSQSHVRRRAWTPRSAPAKAAEMWRQSERPRS